VTNILEYLRRLNEADNAREIAQLFDDVEHDYALTPDARAMLQIKITEKAANLTNL